MRCGIVVSYVLSSCLMGGVCGKGELGDDGVRSVGSGKWGKKSRGVRNGGIMN